MRVLFPHFEGQQQRLPIRVKPQKNDPNEKVLYILFLVLFSLSLIFKSSYSRLRR